MAKTRYYPGPKSFSAEYNILYTILPNAFHSKKKKQTNTAWDHLSLYCMFKETWMVSKLLPNTS